MTDPRPAIADPQPAGRVARRRWWRWPVRIVVALVLIVAVSVGYLAWSLTRGAIESTLGAEILASHLTSLLGPDRQVNIGVVALALTDDMAPEIRLRDVRIVHPDDLAVSLNSLEIESSWQTFAGGARRVRAIHADRLLVQNIGPNSTLPTLAQVLEGVRLLVADLGLEYFEISSLTFRDDLPGTPSHERLGNVSITAETKDRTSVNIQAIALGAQGTMALDVNVALPTSDPNYRVDVHTRGFDFADLSTLIGQESAPAGGSVGLQASADFTPAGDLVGGRGALSFGPLRQNSGSDSLVLVPVPVTLEMSWNAGSHALEINPSPVVFEGGHFIASGAITPPADARTTWLFDLSVNGPDPLSNQPGVRGHLAGTNDEEKAEFVFDDVRFDGSGTSLTAAVRGSSLPGSRYLVMSGISPHLPLATLKALWPPVLAGDARSWVVDNIRAGEITDAHVDVTAREADLAAGKPGSASVSFRFANGVFQPYPDGPVIRDASGEGKLDGDHFEITVENGWSDFGDGRRLTLSASRFSVPFGNDGVRHGSIDLGIAGPASAAFALWNSLPMADATDFSPDPAKMSGQVAMRLGIDLPLVENLSPDDIKVTGKITLTNWVPGEPVQGHALKDGDITVDLDGDVAHVTGKAVVDGAAADLDLRMPLNGQSAARSSVKLTLDEAARRSLGLDLSGFLSGPVVATVESSTAGKDVQTIGIDLTKADLRLSALGFSKSAGKPGRVTFKLRRTPDGTTHISELSLKSGSTTVEGDVTLDGDGIASVDLPRCTIAEGDRFAVKASRQDNKGYKISLTGNVLNGIGLVNALLRPAGTVLVLDRPLSVTAAIDSVSGFNGEVLTGVNISAELVSHQIRALSASVQSGGASASATITPNGKEGRLRIEAGDVGSLLRFFDIYPRVYGGRAIVSGSISADGRVKAGLDGSNWKVVEEPAFARLSTASAVGPTSGLSTADIRRLNYTLTFGDGRLSISEGYLRTDTAGLTMNGDVDFIKDMLHLAGSYLPASQIDRLLGAVPILGWTIFNGGHAGLLGVSYRLNGPIGSPELTVNPLSAVAPGIFRRLFEMK